MFNLATGQDLPHRVASAEVPPPVRHFAAPEAADVPLPSPGLSKSPLRSTTAAPAHRRRRSTGSNLDRAISRSRSPSGRPAPQAWSQDDLQKLRDLKGDKAARPAWKTIAGKLARSVEDCKMQLKRLRDEDSCKLGSVYFIHPFAIFGFLSWVHPQDPFWPHQSYTLAFTENALVAPSLIFVSLPF